MQKYFLKVEDRLAKVRMEKRRAGAAALMALAYLAFKTVFYLTGKVRPIDTVFLVLFAIIAAVGTSLWYLSKAKEEIITQVREDIVIGLKEGKGDKDSN